MLPENIFCRTKMRLKFFELNYGSLPILRSIYFYISSTVIQMIYFYLFIKLTELFCPKFYAYAVNIKN